MALSLILFSGAMKWERGWRARKKGYRWLGGKTFICKFSAYAYDRNH